jgi:hypothetical protein
VQRVFGIGMSVLVSEPVADAPAAIQAGRVSPSLLFADERPSTLEIVAKRAPRMSFAKKWEDVEKDSATLPCFTQEEILRGIGVVLRRTRHTEQALERERLRVDRLVSENAALKQRVKELQGVVSAANESVCTFVSPK